MIRVDEDLKRFKGEEIGRGSEKVCYINMEDPSHCIKVSQLNNCVQINREIQYLQFIEKKNLSLSFLPKFFYVFKTKNYIGYEQESIISKEKGGEFDKVISLRSYLESNAANIDLILEALLKLKREMHGERSLFQNVTAR